MATTETADREPAATMGDGVGDGMEGLAPHNNQVESTEDGAQAEETMQSENTDEEQAAGNVGKEESQDELEETKEEKVVHLEGGRGKGRGRGRGRGRERGERGDQRPAPSLHPTHSLCQVRC
eukprot:3796881-Rhodomonas_salina.1